MKQLNKIIFGTVLFSALSTFTACNSYEDEAPRIDNDNSYFYFPSTELTSSERAEYEAIKKEYKDNIGE
ncbi:hypothetical protein [Coprobacter sp.]